MEPAPQPMAAATRDEVLRAAARLGLVLDEPAVESARRTLDEVLSWAATLPLAAGRAPREGPAPIEVEG